MTAIQVFYQSDGTATRDFYERLTKLGPEGELAVALFRALKRSKKPTGFAFRRVSKRKAERIDNAEAFGWAVEQIVRVLACNAQLKYAWGWDCGFLHVQLPTGLVRFECEHAGLAPAYFEKAWNQSDADAVDLRIIQFCDSLESASVARTSKRVVSRINNRREESFEA